MTSQISTGRGMVSLGLGVSSDKSGPTRGIPGRISSASLYIPWDKVALRL